MVRSVPVALPGVVRDSTLPVTRLVTVFVAAASGVPAAVVSTSVWVWAAVSKLICWLVSTWSGPSLSPFGFAPGAQASDSPVTWPKSL